MSDADFENRIAAIGAQVDQDTVAVNRCAEELRGLIEQHPRSVEAALEVPNDAAVHGLGAHTLSMTMRPSSAIAKRAREDVARRQLAMMGNRKAVDSV